MGEEKERREVKGEEEVQEKKDEGNGRRIRRRIKYRRRIS